MRLAVRKNGWICYHQCGMITNILWYKLSKGFGNNDFPQNINSVLKAKIVLSNLISQNVSKNLMSVSKHTKKGWMNNSWLRDCWL
ncbi:MAG: hypothetical protein ACLSGK_12520 [Lachnospiraceae bacterium]